MTGLVFFISRETAAGIFILFIFSKSIQISFFCQVLVGFERWLYREKIDRIIPN